MLLGDGSLVARLGYVDSRLVEVFPWKCALSKQQLATLKDLFLSIKHLLGLLCIGLRLADFLGKTGARCSFVGGLRLLVATFIFLCSRAQVAILEHRQQLPLMNRAAALHQKLSDRSADLGNNRR